MFGYLRSKAAMTSFTRSSSALPTDQPDNVTVPDAVNPCGLSRSTLLCAPAARIADARAITPASTINRLGMLSLPSLDASPRGTDPWTAEENAEPLRGKPLPPAAIAPHQICIQLPGRGLRKRLGRARIAAQARRTSSSVVRSFP